MDTAQHTSGVCYVENEFRVFWIKMGLREQNIDTKVNMYNV